MSNPKLSALAILLLLLTGCAAKRPILSYVTHSEWGYVAHCPNGEAGWWATKPSAEEVTEFCEGGER